MDGVRHQSGRKDLPSPVCYLIYRGPGSCGLPAGKSYAYVLAGNGLLKYARGRHFEALIPVGRSRVAGLPQAEPAVACVGRLPSCLLSEVLKDARRQAWDQPREAMYHIHETQRGVVSVIRPDQTGTMAHLAYRGGGEADILADIHSHCQMRAYFSSTDNRDEQGLRFYAVIGRIFTRPEIALRVGIYGDHWRVPVTTLFDTPGPFVDTYEEDGAWKS